MVAVYRFLSSALFIIQFSRDFLRYTRFTFGGGVTQGWRSFIYSVEKAYNKRCIVFAGFENAFGLAPVSVE